MPFFFKLRLLLATILCLSLLPCVVQVYAVMDPRFELDPQTLTGVKKSIKPHTSTAKRPLRRSRAEHSSTISSKVDVYTVKPGDHLYRILMREYGLSNKEAELFIEKIRKENNIDDITCLKIGQKISIPPVRRHSDGSLKRFQAVGSDVSLNTGSNTVPKHSLKLEFPVAALTVQEAYTRVQDVWNQIIPENKEQQKPLSFQTPTFSLALDPARYPTFARMDGGRIVMDQDGSIPPLVKSLIEHKDPSVRIVTESPVGTKRFMTSLLESAGFYSVEENFSMEFGVDPKLTVQADFKVEKTAESLIKQDVVLVNSGCTSFPPILGEFLKKEGFSLYEPFASLKHLPDRDSRTINFVSAKNQPELIDSILSAVLVSPERDRRFDVFADDNNGITLSVMSERYFERAGKRFVVTSFDGNPINYTLFRILETKGYNVVILEAKDDFRSVAEKLFSRMKIQGAFAQHNLVQDESAGYSLRMSGYKLDDALLPAGGVFLTDRPMDRIVRGIVNENGFKIK